MLATKGTLKIGDNIVVGRQHGKVRAMLDHAVSRCCCLLLPAAAAAAAAVHVVMPRA
jgi:hypothetical protein